MNNLFGISIAILAFSIVPVADGLECFFGYGKSPDRVNCPGSCFRYFNEPAMGMRMGCEPSRHKEGCEIRRSGETYCYCNMPLCNRP